MDDTTNTLWLSLDLDPGVADFLGLPHKVYLPVGPNTPLPETGAAGFSLDALGRGLTRAVERHPEMSGHPDVLRFLARWPRLMDLERFAKIGNHNFAARTARRLLETDPDDPPALAALAREAVARGAWTEAVTLYGRALDRAPTHGATRIAQALAVAMGGDPGAAVMRLRPLRNHARWGSAARLWDHELKLGRMSGLTERWDALLPEITSREDLDDLIRAFPGNPEVLFAEGVHPMSGLDPATRRERLTDALETAPDHGPARGALAMIQAGDGDPAAAFATVEAGLERTPDAADLRALRGQLLEQLGRADTARSTYRGLFEQPLGQLPTEALARAAQGLLRVGNDDETRALLDDAREARPGDPVPHQFLARLDERAGDSTAAERRIRDAIRSCGPLPVLQYGLGDLLRRTGRSAEAEGLFKVLVQRHPASPWGHRGLGDLVVAEQPAAAVEHYARALARDPASPIPGHDYLRGVAALRADDADEASRWLRRAVAGEPDNGRYWCDLGAALFYAGRIDEAIAATERAARAEPDHPGFLHNLSAFHRARFAGAPLRHWRSLWRSWRLGRRARRSTNPAWRRDLWVPGEKPREAPPAGASEPPA